ncbi:MAG: peptide deformylase [Anaerolineales bacterium]|nr:peptide deformylase [Anaerolineales bacterium]
MAIREVVTLPHPVLRRKARKVTDFGPELQVLVDDMVETMRQAPGVGLAANQINVPLQVIVVEYHETENDEESPLKLYTVVNPTITRASQEIVLGTEGCLSVPGILGNVERSEAITVKGQNRRGQPVTIKAKGWLARIFQHEIDHLEGVIFVDRADKAWKVETEPGQVLPDNV